MDARVANRKERNYANSDERIQLADDGSRTVDKDYKGQRIFQRLGTVSQNDAEAWLSARQAEIDAQRANALRRGGQRLWADAARKYLMECQTRKVRTLDLISFHALHRRIAAAAGL